jgi:YVTN family beta-propeller protein
MSTSLHRWLLSALLVTGCAASAAAQTFTTFETGQVRPLAMSPDGTRLFAVDTPDNRLEVFSISAGGLTHTASVPVGLEPVAVAARTNGEVWVVNHLSDSVSIVDVSTTPPRVTRTLLVGDEPRDIVFAGPGGNRAFITAAHRGQNRPGDPQLTTAGVGRADVWVFDATSLGATLGGTPLNILSLFGDTPRALAVAPGGGTVYAAVFHSGNQTTTVSEGAVCNGGAAAAPCNVSGFTMPGGLPAPNTNFQGIPQREVGLIVKFDNVASQWKDELGRNWNNAVRFSLPDQDVFAINANANPPAQTATFAHVGTILFNMVTNPVSGKVYVTNTDARNEVRFEGPGTFFGSTTVQGHLQEARITVLDGANVIPRHLNKHINYAVRPAPAGTADKSLAQPNGMAVNAAGTTLYVAALGSSKVGVFNTAQLENDTFTPSASDHIVLSGGGPTGLVLDEPRGRLYVMTRFDNAVKVVDTGTKAEIAAHPLHSAEPAIVKNGRSVLYDAMLSSSNGEASCASCHIFGDFDSLAWDLGNPDDVMLNNPNPIRLGGIDPDFHPLKGPMTTQSLRGMANHGPMHWRGDRTGGNDPGGDALDEMQAFEKFSVAFEGLLGKATSIPQADMDRFTSFILQVTYPPNPIRPLDNTLSANAQLGSTRFFGPVTDAFANCDTCHVTDEAQGFFGTDGFTTFENEPQELKIPHLRNMYQKVGMFGMPAVPFLTAGDNGNKGPQIRGFGFLHDGSIDTTERFHRATVFSNTQAQAQQLEQFMLEFPSNLKPIVGQQITLTSTNAATVGPRINLLIARDTAGDCELTVKGTIGGLQRGAVRLASGLFQTDREGDAPLTDAAVRALATVPGQELTYTCVPPGEGERIGVDRDGDGAFDRDEIDAGTDPTDPSSFPGSVVYTLVQSTSLTLKDDSTPPANPAKRKVSFKSNTKLDLPANRITPPAPGSPGDPTMNGATVVVSNGAGQTNDAATIVLPASGWTLLGTVSNPKGYRFKQSGGTISSVVLKTDSLTIKGGKAGFDYTLNEPQQGSVAVRLNLADLTGWCANSPAKTSGSPPSTANNDKVDKFIGRKKAPAPASCPGVPSGSPSGAFLE